ncbi:hypothetical protein [Alicyclobacillus sendaiensis]|uniref:hypothetical protein n=1 Tax=Alicyclobacillus sendaiensis TaxID=192387 RepID=UPI000783FC27|nr:hypothetical protein [Alicyclobacillus sendaiensis]
MKVLNAIKQFNRWLAIKVTQSVGTMTTAYLFSAWALLPLVFPRLQNLVAYVSQDYIQLVLLPVIMVGQAVMGWASEKRAQETHDAVMAELSELRKLNESQAAEIAELKAIHRELEAKLGRRAHER